MIIIFESYSYNVIQSTKNALIALHIKTRSRYTKDVTLNDPLCLMNSYIESTRTYGYQRWPNLRTKSISILDHYIVQALMNNPIFYYMYEYFCIKYANKNIYQEVLDYKKVYIQKRSSLPSELSPTLGNKNGLGLKTFVFQHHLHNKYGITLSLHQAIHQGNGSRVQQGNDFLTH